METVLVIDDSRLHRENLTAALVLDGRYTPVEAWDLPTLVSALKRTEPVVMLLNIASRGRHLLLRAAMELNPGGRVIVVGASDEDEAEVLACAEGGAVGYHMKSDSLEQLLELIDRLCAGDSECPPRIAAILLRRVSVLAARPQSAAVEPVLTAREAQILRMLEMGRSNRDIAKQLSIAVHTVKNHVHSLLTKLGVNTRAEAAALSYERRANRGAGGRTRPRSIQS